jgi:hypothetical protein
MICGSKAALALVTDQKGVKRCANPAALRQTIESTAQRLDSWTPKKADQKQGSLSSRQFLPFA